MQAMTYWTESSRSLTREAKNLWYQVEILDKNANFFAVKTPKKYIFFKASDFWGNSSLAFKICNDKMLTHIFLERYGFPVAQTQEISREDFDTQKIQDFRFPVVVKPVDEWHGNGVKMNIESNEELLATLTTSFQVYPRLLIQSQVSGDDYRILVVKWEIVVAYKRTRPTITGDGKETILELIKKENHDNPLRSKGYSGILTHIKIDEEMEQYIKKQNYDFDTILDVGKTITVRSNGNVGTGGNMEDATQKIHPEIQKVALAITEKLGMDICGIDLMIEDISRPFSETGGIILELNATPWLWGIFETTGINVAKEIIEKACQE